MREPLPALLIATGAWSALEPVEVQATCAPSAGVVICSPEGAEYPTGINYQNEAVAAPNLTMQIDPGVTVSTTGGQDGVSIEQLGDITLTTSGAVNITIGNMLPGDRDGMRVDSELGSVSIDTTANVTTNNVEGDGIIARSNLVDPDHVAWGDNTRAHGPGSVLVRSSGAISTSGNLSTGITAGAAGALVHVEVTGDITTTGAAESGAIVVANYGLAANTEARVDFTGADLRTSGTESAGIAATALLGRTTVNTIGGSIETLGERSVGIGGGSGLTSLTTIDATLVTPVVLGSTIDINNGTSASAINDGTRVNTAGAWGFGMSALSRGAAVALLNRGNLTTTGNVATGIGVLSAFISPGGVTKGGTLTIDNRSSISTGGGSAAGIGVIAFSSDISITSSGVIATSGDAIGVPEFDALGVELHSSGILAALAMPGGAGGNGNIAVTTTAAGDISTTGIEAHGIEAVAFTGTIDIDALGAVTTQGAQSNGITATTTAGAISIDAAEVSTSGADAAGVFAQSQSGGIAITLAQASTSGARADALHATSNSGLVNAQLTGAVTATGQDANGALVLSSTQAVDVQLSASAAIAGGWSTTPGTAAGLSIGGGAAGASQPQAAFLDNAGSISALSDLAVDATTNGGLLIENNGTIAGYLRFDASSAGAPNTFNNHSPTSFNIRHFADTNGDGVRDTERVAISDFGGPNASFVNTSNGVVRLLSVSGATTTDASGTYAPAGLDASFYDISRAGVEQGHFVNLATFRNAGIIEMRDASTGGGGPVAGDVLVIGGGALAGSLDGVYISDGGELHLDTVLNEGGANSQSDTLIAGATQLGAGGATRVRIAALGTGAFTPGDGIKIVDVLDPTQSAADAFTLGHRVVAGAYEYQLFQGGRSSADGDWYLRSEQPPPDPPDPPDPPGPGPDPDPGGGGDPGPIPEPLYRPEVAAYLNNQWLAQHILSHTLHERGGFVQPPAGGPPEEQERKPFWFWANGRLMDVDDSSRSDFAAKSGWWLMRLGGDFAQIENDDGGRLHLGLIGTGARTSTHARAVGNRAKAKAHSSGYAAGVYATWHARESERHGAYVDVISQYGWFDNNVAGDGLASQEYDSEVHSSSLEIGYGFKLSSTEDIVLEPEVQILYSDYEQDRVVEAGGTLVTGAGDSALMSRVGLRLFEIGHLEDRLQTVFEVNWWHDFDRATIAFDAESFALDVARDRFDIGGSFNAAVTSNISFWANFEYQMGERFVGLEATTGFKIRW